MLKKIASYKFNRIRTKSVAFFSIKHFFKNKKKSSFKCIYCSKKKPLLKHIKNVLLLATYRLHYIDKETIRTNTSLFLIGLKFIASGLTQTQANASIVNNCFWQNKR